MVSTIRRDDPLGVPAAVICSSTNWRSPIFLAVFLTTFASAAQTSTETLNPAEKWVLERITAGNDADLRKQFRQEKDRKLSAKFVQDLLTGNLSDVKLHRNGVRIFGAVIEERIDMRAAQIPLEVSLNECQFSNVAIFERANFQGTVSFNHSTFLADANFNGAKVGQPADFSNVVFAGRVDFGSADIASHFYATKAHFWSKETSFNSMKVRGTAFFHDAEFAGWWVDFRLADITQNFEAMRAQFTLFLPVIDLKTSELWGPKPEYRFLRHYVRVHILLDWILVPLVLAALTGLIK